MASRLQGVVFVSLIESPHGLVSAAVVFLSQLFLTGCTTRLIQLQPERGTSISAPSGQRLEVIVSVAAGCDPMAVRNERVVYGGLGDAASRSIIAAAMPWAEHHRVERVGGWQMLVEILRCDATASGTRLTVEVETRVTMRASLGHTHLGQTHDRCKESDVTDDLDGSRIVFRCLDRMARELAGWLEGITP